MQTVSKNAKQKTNGASTKPQSPAASGSWSVEEALEHALKLIERGDIIPETCVITMRCQFPKKLGNPQYLNVLGGPFPVTHFLGVMEIGKQILLTQQRGQ
jgi:hypothetical protein|tara:strand:- start:190 stop:489 length:300 start_codon:yes stop_codon:yes gene_type:complete